MVFKPLSNIFHNLFLVTRLEFAPSKYWTVLWQLCELRNLKCGKCTSRGQCKPVFYSQDPPPVSTLEELVLSLYLGDTIWEFFKKWIHNDRVLKIFRCVTSSKKINCPSQIWAAILFCELNCLWLLCQPICVTERYSPSINS